MPQRLSLKGRALQLLAQREHSRVELRRKLLTYANQHAQGIAKSGAGIEPAGRTLTRRLPPAPEVLVEVDALLDWLVENRHLSETRFLEARVRTRAARLGNLRIRQELAQHGLQLDPEAEKALNESELARARQVWARKFDAPAGDAAGRARQMRFLAGRGFSADVIRRLLRGDEDD
jgi:regulatory protein